MTRYAKMLFWAVLFGLLALTGYVSAASITETKAAIGKNCVASGDYSTAMGCSTTASGDYSTAMGCWSTASGDYSTAMGYNNTASGHWSTAMGNCATASGDYSTAMGKFTTASGDYSTAMGFGWDADHILINDIEKSFMVGYMSSQTDTEPEFFVKNGAVGFGTKTPTEQVTIRTPSQTDTKILFTEATSPIVSMFYEASAGTGTNNLFHIRSEISGSERNIMTWKLNGYVGIGKIDPGYLLEVNGNAGKPGGGSWSNSSDVRLKDINGDYDAGLNEIVGLRPVTFYYKEGNPRGLPTDQEYIGFIAQEVEEIFPEAVSEGPDGYLDFNMHPINVAVINAIMELKARNDALETENALLKRDIEKIKKILGI